MRFASGVACWAIWLLGLEVLVVHAVKDFEGQRLRLGPVRFALTLSFLLEYDLLLGVSRILRVSHHEEQLVVVYALLGLGSDGLRLFLAAKIANSWSVQIEARAVSLS